MRNLLVVIAALLIVAGVLLFSIPAGLIVLGLLLGAITLTSE